MAWYPHAIRKQLSRNYAGIRPLTVYNRMNLHVAVSEAPSLFAFFNGPGKPSSHFYVRKDGTVEQYVDTARQAEADLEGNDATISVETQGGVKNPQGEPWTDAQVKALADLFAWVHETHGIPMRLADDSKIGNSSRGLSWHRLGIDGNFPKAGILAGRIQRGGGMHYSHSRGKVCPGDTKIRQVPEVLRLARTLVAGPFKDVGPDHQFAHQIEWMDQAGITNGYSDGTFRPGEPVTREAVAAFLYRMKGRPAVSLPRRSPFKDVPKDSQFYREIVWLDRERITTGYEDGTFRPKDHITREAMAAFLYRLAGRPTFAAPKRPTFKDVRPGSQFYREIEWLASERITTGYHDGTFRPRESITREATAAFLYRYQ